MTTSMPTNELVFGPWSWGLLPPLPRLSCCTAIYKVFNRFVKYSAKDNYHAMQAGDDRFALRLVLGVAKMAIFAV